MNVVRWAKICWKSLSGMRKVRGMFTGLIQDTGQIQDIQDRNGEKRLQIRTALDMDRHDIGASMACSGCCLTIVEKGAGWFAVDVSAESLSRTTIATWEEGTLVNIEPSLRAGDELGGHFVTGHIDGIARIESVTAENNSRRVRLRAPDTLRRFIAPKGSVALDGISLTVNEVEGSVFGVNIIPHTWDKTTFRALQTSNMMHIEIDVLARYAASILDERQE